MRGGAGERHPVAGELSQRGDREIPARCSHGARGSKADAAHASCRSASRTTEGKEGCDFVRKIVSSHCRPLGETRTNNFVFEPTRFFHFSVVQQLRRSTQLPELQRCAHISPAAGSRRKIKLSLVRAHCRCSKKVPSLRTGRADLLRVRHGESGINRCA